MQAIDWIIIVSFIIFLVGVAIFANRYVKSVSDFLTGGRCAGRYLLCVSEGAAAFAAVGMVAAWEMYYKAGFSVLWWQEILPAVLMFLALSGWVIYRYRQTRVMTMAQFFEVRYSKKFRVFSGILAFAAGILNYGIFPAIACRCLIYFCDIPIHYINLFGIELNVTLGVMMAVMLTIAITITLLGGQLSVLVSSFCEGQLCNSVFVVTAILLVFKVGWVDIIETLKTRPAGQSMLNPFDAGKVSDFNMWFFILSALLCIYGYKAWQGTQGYNCAAKNPHEARMAGILATWRDSMIRLILVMAPIISFVILSNHKFSNIADSLHRILASVTDARIRDQMTVSITIRELLPVGIRGFFIACIVAATISTDSTCLHSWGTIFIQDVVLPLSQNRLSTQQHVRLLRCSMIGVAVFAWFFSMVFPLKEYLYMFFSITGSIYIGGAGSAIIGGLYWKRGTTAGAWAGMITGSLLSFGGILINNILWPLILPSLKGLHLNVIWLQSLGETPPFNGMQISFTGAITSILVYVVVSLLTKPDPDFDMDKMLHRGKYEVVEVGKEKHVSTTKGIMKRLGITDEFTFGDRIIYFASMGISIFWIGAFIIGTILHRFFGSTDDTWSKWWFFKMGTIGILAIIVTIWFSIGGIINLFELFKNLRVAKRNELDDGSVKGHQNIADLEVPERHGKIESPAEDLPRRQI